MGIWISRMMDYLFSTFKEAPVRVLMLGLDGAGKTTLLYKLKLNEIIHSIPTIGFNVETVDVGKGASLVVWDVGGQGKIRTLWRYYFQNADGLIYMVDSTDRERLNDAREELYSILADPNMDHVPLLVFANKQDMPGSMTAGEVLEAFCMHDLAGHKWHVQACSAVTGKGIYEGIEEFVELMKFFRSCHKRE